MESTLVQGLASRLSGGEARMEHLLFRMLCIAAALLCLFVVIPSNYCNHLPLGINLAVLIFVVGTLFLYREARRGRYRLESFFLLTLLLLNSTWFANGGSLGSVGCYFCCLFTYCLIFFRGRKRWLLLAVALASVIALMTLERYFPSWVVAYQSPERRLDDLAVAVLVSALCCSLMLWTVLTDYDREQKRLTGLNEELLRNMERRIEAEQTLQRKEELLELIMDAASDAIYVKDSQGRYLIFNKGAALMTGKSPEEMLGEDDTLLFPQKEARAIMAADRKILAHGEMLNIEQQLVMASGQEAAIQTVKGPLRDQRGEIIGTFGVSRDVTESRRLAEELHKLNEELEQRVQERTALLEAAVREQEAFSYSVSHDLRGPLRHINGYAGILEEEFGAAASPEARGYLERIRSSSSRMGKLIDNLLELSRIGRSELRKVPVNLSDLAGSICGKLREGEPERRVECAVTPGLTVRGDRVLLWQMLHNLLENAWKYSGKREPARIEFGCEPSADGRVFFVRDNGVGFDMLYQDKLFGAFQRLHGAEFEGAGIGLATVKRIVERHGGDVWAEAAVDRGATLYFTLP